MKVPAEAEPRELTVDALIDATLQAHQVMQQPGAGTAEAERLRRCLGELKMRLYRGGHAERLVHDEVLATLLAEAIGEDLKAALSEALEGVVERLKELDPGRPGPEED